MSSKKIDTGTLKNAIATIEKFAKKNATTSVVHVADLAVKNGEIVAKESSPFRKSLQIACNFISAAFFGKSQRADVKKTLLDAINLIKQNHLYLEKMQEGNKEERSLAASSIAAIRRYNTLLEKADNATPPWHARAARFFYKYSGLSVEEELKQNRIELPNVVSVQSDDIQTPAEIFPLAESANPIFKKEADALRIKTNTLLRDHEVCFHTISEMLKTVRTAPIQASLDDRSATSTLFLTLDIIPGMTVKVKGSFKRNEISSTQSRPIADSFHLSWKSTQTGFPHPSQHTGWALADPLISSHSQDPEAISLHRKKNEAAHTLLPNGSRFEHAKYLLRLRKQAFQECSEEWLDLHEQLSHAILGNSRSVAEAFYKHLKETKQPLDTLIETYHHINEIYIVKPYASLQQRLYQQEDKSFNPEFFLNNELEDSEKIVENLNAESHIVDFVRCFGKVIGVAACNIFMQHTLNDFELKLLSAAYQQLQAFLDELDLDLDQLAEEAALALIKSRIRTLLEADIALFQRSSANSA